MNELIQTMSSLGFSKVGDVIFDSKYGPNFALTEKKAGKGWVYIWLEIGEDEAKVVYVGKVGKSLHERCDQHVGGFRGGSTTGSVHAARIRAGIESGKRYELYSKKADVVTIFSEKNISMVDT